MVKKVVIVGGVAGGATAAARLRRISEEVEIVMFEKGPYISFANCGLPYYIGGEIQDRQKLLVQTEEGMERRFNLDIRVESEVVSILPEEKKVVVKDLKTGEVYEEDYEALLLSPGAKPIVPPIEGLQEAQHVFTLRTVPDTDRIKAFVDETHPERVAVIGGGFIGLEMAENLAHKGMKVSIIEMAPQVMGPLDPEMATYVHRHLEDKGISLYLNNGIQAFHQSGKEIELANGERIEVDFTILSIGVQPENQLAKEAGLRIGARGGIQVNEYFQTSDESIYAIGDAMESVHLIDQSEIMVPLAGPANKQGRLVADTIMGNPQKYKGILGTGIAKVFDLIVATTGFNEKQLNRMARSYQAIHLHPGSHAGYYPGAKQIHLKVLFDPETKLILGAQAVGEDGVDKRIDVLATAITAGMLVTDLADIELAYAPPFSSAKDPVNMAGYIARNILEDGIQTIQWHEVDALVESGAIVVDVRNESERSQGFIPGSVCIPLDEIRERLSEFPRDQKVYVSCQVGLRGYTANRILKGNGFDVANIDGGWLTYSAGQQNKR